MVDHFQATLREPISFQGQALFTGKEVTACLIPAEAGRGIVFRRTDLPGCPEVAASTDNVQDSILSTKIGRDGVSIQTIEHLMAALFACGVSNLFIEISGPEVPIFDGSSLPFVELIEQVGVVQQKEIREVYTLDAPCFFSSGETHLIALPSQEFSVSCTIHYPQSPYLKTQYFSSVVTASVFRQEIAACRTYSLYEDVLPLIQKGILKNGKLEHGVVIDGHKVLNPEGLRFSDEPVRHKTLDMIGDIALLGSWPLVHFIGIKPAHASNHAMARVLSKQLRKL